jgi:hypothetical protein
VVGGNALAVINEQVDLGRQRQEGRDQQPVEPGRAAQHAPDGQPGQRLDQQDVASSGTCLPSNSGTQGTSDSSR